MTTQNPDANDYEPLTDDERAALRRSLDHNEQNTWFTRGRALRYLLDRDALPVRDPEQGGDRLVAAEVVSDPRGGWYAKSQTWIQSHDCPRCGYDRAERTHENYHDIEAAETVECRACGYVIDQWDTL